MTWWLKALGALTEEPGPIPSTHVAVHNCLCLSPSSDLPGTVTHTVHSGKNDSCQGSNSRGNEEGLTESSASSSEWQLIDLPSFYFLYRKGLLLICCGY